MYFVEVDSILELMYDFIECWLRRYIVFSMYQIVFLQGSVILEDYIVYKEIVGIESSFCQRVKFFVYDIEFNVQNFI